MSNLRFTLKSAEGGDEAVNAADFASFLSSLLACLSALEDETRVQAPVEYKVVGLEVGSAVIEIRPVSSGDLDRSAERVARTFEEGFAALENDEIRSTPFSRRTKARFLQLAKPLRRSTRAIEFRGTSQTVTLSRREPLRDLPRPKTIALSRGSMKGDVDAMNVHSKPVFYLYPRSGPTRVRCTFGPELLDQLREAIKRSTTVFGLMEYEAENAFPVRVLVERVEVNPPDDQLPALISLWGAAPHLTGSQSTREYLDGLRDE